MSHRQRHVPAEQLTALALAPAVTSADDRLALDHIEACESCAQALAQLTTEVADWRRAAASAADAQFDDGALEAQRFRILDRLAHLGQSARVLRFPGRSVARSAQRGLVSRRWISAAAAAGLLIGIVTGRVLHIIPGDRALHVQADAARVAARPPGPSIVQASISMPTSDDELLDEIDRAVRERQHARELRALDALTPTLNEIR
jgi:hypothetical protein